MNPDDRGAVVALIGDIVLSREIPDQQMAFRRLSTALEAVNQEIESLQPLEMTVGDAFQALYQNLDQALDASLLLRVLIGQSPLLRVGLGRGTSERTLPEKPLAAGQTGSAWWGAEAALASLTPRKSEEMRKSPRRRARHGWPNSLRTAIRIPGEPELEGLATAFLVCRDALLDKLDDADRKILLGFRKGETQTAMTRELSLSQSAISSRAHGRGILALWRAHESLDSKAR